MRANLASESVNCPPRNRLDCYFRGELSPEESAEFESHFDTCPPCEESLRKLAAASPVDDKLDPWLRRALDFPSASDAEHLDAEDLARVDQLRQRLADPAQFYTPIESQSDAANANGHSLLFPSSVQPIETGPARNDGVLAERLREIQPFLQEPPRAPQAKDALHREDASHGPLGILAHYRLEHALGCGASSVVFRAHDQQLDRDVVLKILRPSLGHAARVRFLAEARAAASIEHPHVVTIYQVGEAQQLAFLAMQWIPGQTLESLLHARSQSKPHLAETLLRQIGGQVAHGLHAAHSQNLIHRDIKPANIWLSENEEQVSILDFGLARAIDDDPQMTHAGVLAGTPSYMSPEQSRGMELDGRSDLFSLGCALYQSATGQLPFGGRGILATIQSIQSDTPRHPALLNPNLSDEFCDLLLCLLEKQPANRPPSAAKLAAAFSSHRQEWTFPVGSYAPQSSPAGHLHSAAPATRTQSSGGHRNPFRIFGAGGFRGGLHLLAGSGQRRRSLSHRHRPR